MRIVFVGDIVGKNGMKALENFLPAIKREFRPQVTIANGENVSDGRGITEKHYKQILNQGVDVVTLGNHAFDQWGTLDYIDGAKSLVRPYNLPSQTPGQGVRFIKVNQYELAVVNVLGTAFMNQGIDPFNTLEERLQEIRQRTPFIFIDFHAESTSEKQAFGWWLDGKVSAVVGTHTHVQTNDARILPQGTAYLTDCGMTGSRDSIIGFKARSVINRFTSHLPGRMEVEERGPYLLSACMVDINDGTGQATHIETILKVNS